MANTMHLMFICIYVTSGVKWIEAQKISCLPSHISVKMNQTKLWNFTSVLLEELVSEMKDLLFLLLSLYIKYYSRTSSWVE